MSPRTSAAARVLALIEQSRAQAEAVRQLAAALDVPGLPERFAEQAADAAAHLERLTDKLDDYFHGRR